MIIRRITLLSQASTHFHASSLPPRAVTQVPHTWGIIAASNSVPLCMVRCCTCECCWWLDGQSIHWQQLLKTSKTLTQLVTSHVNTRYLHNWWCTTWSCEGKVWLCSLIRCYVVLCATLSPPTTVAGNNIASCMRHLNYCHDHHATAIIYSPIWLSADWKYLWLYLSAVAVYASVCIPVSLPFPSHLWYSEST